MAEDLEEETEILEDVEEETEDVQVPRNAGGFRCCPVPCNFSLPKAHADPHVFTQCIYSYFLIFLDMIYNIHQPMTDIFGMG